MPPDEHEQKLLRSVALQNAQAVLLARERAERELRESNERITSILESISDAFIALDREWRFIYVNPQAEEMVRPLHKTRSGLLGKDYWVEFPDLLGTLLEKNFRRAVAQQVKVDFEIFYPPLNSWLQVRAYPSPGGLSVYYLDITEQKVAAEAVRESAERLHAMFNQAAVGIAMTSLDGRFLEANQRFSDVLGYSREELRNLTFGDVTYEDDLEMTRSHTRRLLAGEVADFAYEKRYVRKDGSLVWSLTTVTLLRDAAARPQSLMGVIEDITSRKLAETALRASEERFRAIVETSPECVKVVGADGAVQHMNSSGLAMVGADSPEMVVGRNFYDLIAPEDRDRFRHFNESICRGERGSLKFRIIGLQGNHRYMESHAAPLRNADGAVQQLAVTRDVTERKRIEERLRKAEKMAAAGQLAASLSHEINNPLSSVTNALYLLKHHSGLHQQAQDLVEMAGNELARMSRIVQQSLAYYREGVTPKDIDIGATVEESVQVYGNKFARAGIQLTKKIGAGNCIVGFPDEIRQVVDNLLLNAVEAMPSGGRLNISVHASADWKDRNREGVRLTVADSGSGMSRDVLGKIFEPFFTTKPEKGTGLGLWVVHGLVAKHDGTIRVRSSERKGKSGTAISILWPLSTRTHDPTTMPGAKLVT